MSHPKDNGRALAERAIRQIENAVFQVLGAGEGRIEIEIRQVARDRVRLIVTAGATKVTTLAATDLGSRLLARGEAPAVAARPARTADPTGPMPPARSRRYLTAADVARRYGISEKGVRQRHRRGQLPPAVAVGRRHLWDEADLDRFDDAHRARSTPTTVDSPDRSARRTTS